MTGSEGRDKRWALFEQKLRARGLAAAAIPKLPRDGAGLNASFAQQRLLFLEQLTPGTAAYNDHYALTVRGRIDRTLLTRALDQIAARQEALRTIFAFAPNGDVLQIVRDEAHIPLRSEAWSPVAGSFDSWVLDEAVKEARRPFDLYAGPLARATLLSRASDEHVLLFTIHHAIWDGWSSGVLMLELSGHYAALAQGKAVQLPELSTQYADYAQWQRERLSGETLEDKAKYWKQRLAGAPHTIDLPSDRARPRLQTFSGKTLYGRLGVELSARIDGHARAQNKTPFALLFAVFSALLARYSGQRDLVIATPIANRSRLELESLIGCFVNTLALRVELAADPTLNSLMAHVSERLLEAQPHQDLPFEKLVELLGLERDLSRSPLTQVMFVFQNTPVRALEIAGLTFAPLDVDAGFAKLDLTLNVQLTTEGYTTAWEYNTDLFDEASVARLGQHYRQLLSALLDAPDASIFAVELLTAAERQQLLQEWNATRAPYPAEETLQSLFAAQVRRSPDALALVVGERRFSYAELAARAAGVALALRERGVGTGALIAVFLARDEHLICALLGVLLAGAAYVPLDPAYPRDRISLILEDTDARVILTSASLRDRIASPFHERAIDVTQLAAEGCALPLAAGAPEDAAYVIYTSGSTGKPKGVVIEQRNAVSFIAWSRAAFTHAEFAAVLAATSVCFDLSVFEIFGALLAGGAVILADNALSLPELPAAHEVTLINTVPSAVAELLRNDAIPRGVRTVNLAGEPLPEETVLALYALPQIERVYNLYGPSETTTYSTYTLTTRHRWRPVIGRPISNTRAYVLDERLEPVPLGVRGELFLGGLGVARGYLHRDELTAQRFLPDPFAGEAGARMYRTGDVVRWLASGELEYLGRNDHQIKLRGFRIELGEVEAALRAHPAVQDALALVREDRPGLKQLVGYVVPRAGQPLAVEALRASLAASVPEYMVPAKFVLLDALPLSPNGKVDRKRLPPPPERDDARDYVAPRTELEAALGQIWQEVLGVAQVGIDDSFFELGGDSIAAMRLSALARRAGLMLSVAQIFQHPTLAAQAERVTRAARGTSSDELPRAAFPLAPIQRWFFERRLAHPNHYNQSLFIELTPDTDEQTLLHAANAAFARHPAFRLHFEAGPVATVQRFGEVARIRTERLDLTGLPNDAQRAAIEQRAREFSGALDLEHGPLGVAALFRDGTRALTLFITLHHLVVDVVSWHVLLGDITNAYDQLRRGSPADAALPAHHYEEYATRLASYAAAPAGAVARGYWSEFPLELPRLPRAASGDNLSGSAESLQFRLDPARSRELAAQARAAYNLGLDEVLLTALCLALAAWSGNSRLVIDVEKHGRELPLPELELSELVGWFTALFPIEFTTTSDARLALLSIKETLHGPAERGLWFQLLRYGGEQELSTRLARLPAREVVYNFLGNIQEINTSRAPIARVRAPGAAVDHHPANARSHLLEFSGALRDGALELELTFSPSSHQRATMSALLERVARELANLARHLAQPGVGGYSPADFALARVSQRELDAHHERLWRRIVDAYRLTPPQHAIVVDVLRDPHAGYYVPQLHALLARLDPQVLSRSLAWVIERHAALRTAFIVDDMEEPLQVVFAEVAPPLTHEDWRSMVEAERRERLSAFLSQDRQTGFDLERAPLLRLFHARWSDHQDLLVWTIHHAICDGWSLPLIIAETLVAYSAFERSEQPRLLPAPPVRDYLAWLARQDSEAGERYFTERLQGVTPFAIGISPDESYRQVSETTIELGSATSRALEGLAKQHAVTLGSVIQAVWAIVLARYAGRTDVVFGSVDSGRPAELARVDEMVGMFVTTLPLRVSVTGADPLADLFQRVQLASSELREHAYVALARIVRATGHVSLFDSICVIENYPRLEEAVDQRLRLQELGSAEVTRFPLTVTATTRNPVTLSVSASLSDPDAGGELLQSFRHALEQLATGLLRLVQEIDLPLATERRSRAAYWQALLADAPLSAWRLDRARTAQTSVAPARCEFSALSPELSRSLEALASGLHLAPGAVLLAGFCVLMARYLPQDDLLLAVELADGARLPLRVQLGADLSFRTLLLEVQQKLADAAKHADSNALTLCRERVTTLFSLQEASRASFADGFELGAALRRSPEGLQLELRSAPAYLEEHTARRLTRHLLGLLAALLAAPERPLAEVPLPESVGPVSQPEMVPADVTALGLFAERVRRAPSALALLAVEAELSYAELDARASRVAARLHALGVIRGDRVAVRMRRSPELIIALLAIMKAGAAFVGIDVATPAERVHFMLEDCGARLCLQDRADELDVRTQTLAFAALLADAASPALTTEICAGDLAYVIYTSGSTGRPKGVMIEHGSLGNYLGSYGQITQIGPSDRLLQFASPSFDVSVEEIFGTLCHGATLVLRSDDIAPHALLAACRAFGVTLLSLPTAYWNELTHALAAGAELAHSVRLVLIGGERATSEVLSQWHRYQKPRAAVRLLNMYGPTEATISATYAELLPEPAGEPSIGRPVAGAIALVVDAAGHGVPTGVPGELLLGGRCLARGYLNRPELTAEKFTAHPLVPGRVYHTGDLVRWRDDGQLDYLGRIDQQIKLRGFRIELGEIEAVLRAEAEVADAVVILREDPGSDARLVAYVVGNADTERLRQAVRALPSYMVPAAFVHLPELPLTASGKIDRRALPAPSASESASYLAPTSSLERALAEIWQRILRVERVGVDRDFFELGGHSLLATQVVARIHGELGLEASVRDLFEAPTVQRLAARLLDRGGAVADQAIVRRALASAPLSFAQGRLWFLNQLEPGSSAYNMPFALRVRGPLDHSSLARALSELSRRHAILRTHFELDSDGQPRQIIDEQARLELAHARAPRDADSEAWLRARIQADASAPFDLTRGPLIRASWLELGADHGVLLFNMHHIVSDGWSIAVLVRDLGALYRAFASGDVSPLAELPIQYADYALWLRERLNGAELARQLEYWQRALDGAPFRLELPKKPRAQGQSYASATVESALDARLSDRIDALAHELGATPFMVLLSCWALLLSRVSGQPELVIGTPSANRQRAETESLIGLFVNTLAIRADLRGGPSFAELVARLRERVLDAQAHAELPFEKLVEALGVERDLARSPVFQVMFAMQNTPAFDLGVPGLALDAMPSTASEAKFDLTLSIERSAQGYQSSWEYRSDYFDESFVRGLARHFAQLLSTLSNAPEQACDRVSLLSESERELLVNEWNRTERRYPDALLHELISEQVRRTPDAIAVADAARELTYSQLDARAERLARRLLAAGAHIETRIAIALNRSTELVVALLAVQKCGACYVPLDLALPHSRMRDILEDAKVELVLTETDALPRLPAMSALRCLCVDRAEEQPSARHFPARPHPDSLVYVLFTSGSTGRPKGVEISQRALVNVLFALQEVFGLRAADRVVAAANLSFDIAGLELYLPLMYGASIYIATREDATDGQRLAQLLTERRATFFQSTPSSFRMLLASDWQGSPELKLAAIGEAVTVDLAERLLERSAAFWNGYGPTEDAIYATCELLTRERVAAGITIGRPLANYQTYVLDARLEPVPIGVLGELYLGGVGVARGYAGRPELTAERFVANPFGPGRLYRTGDVVRYLSDGAIEFFGRVDHQVKVRGFRIELGDIEAALRRHPDISDAAVLVQSEAADDQRLVAYLVATNAPSADELRGFLKDALPDYMMPAHFLRLERFPTTPSGKLDRKALPKASFGSSTEFVQPRNELERTIALLFSEILRVPSVGAFDNFFELGGHSLLATELVFRLRRRFAVDLPVRKLFESPTVAALASALSAPVTSAAATLPSNVVLARAGAGVPWFLFPALAGTSAPYLSNIPAHGGASIHLLEAPGLDGAQPIASLSQLSAAFADSVRAVAREQRVRLLGWSFGAVSAFMTARALSSSGVIVDELVLVDPAIPGEGIEQLSERELLAAFLADVAESTGKVSASEPLWEETKAAAAELDADALLKLAAERGLFPSSMGSDQIRSRFSVYAANARALREFRPTEGAETYAGKTLILAAREGNGQHTSRWLQFLPYGQLTMLEADHYTILRHLRQLLL